MRDRSTGIPGGLAALALLAVLAAGSGLASPAAADESDIRFTVVVATYASADAAQAAAEKLRGELGESAGVRVEKRDDDWSLRCGYFAGAGGAVAALKRIQALGYEQAWIGMVTWPLPGPEKETPPIRTDTAPTPESAPERAGPPEPLEPRAPVEPSPAGVQPPMEPAPPPAAAPLPVPPAAAPPGPLSSKRIEARRLNGSPVTLDGRLDEEAWTEATFVTGFEQKGELRGYPSPAKTQVAFLYDDKALYIGARVESQAGAVIRAPRTRRDDPADADRIIVSLDTFRDRQTAYNFGVTAGGTLFDFYQPVDVYEVRDMSYDRIWQAKTAVDGQVWTAEMRVPFSSLEFHSGEEQVWGVNLQHISVGERQYEFWIVVPAAETGWSSRFGDLVGLEGVSSSPRIAITPYAAGERRRNDSGVDPEDEWRYGGDVDVDFPSGLSLDATFNPDFGQIEADPAAVNLTDYEIFFPEKRPFFVEGAQLFQGTGPRYFYSRRIGAPPHADFHDEFDENGTTILGAAKLIGRLRSGWSLGFLGALTDEETVLRAAPEGGPPDDFPVEPRTGYAVTRVQRDFGAGSTFGFVATGTQRNLDHGSDLDLVLPEQAFSGGFDWNLRFAEQTHEFAGFAGASLVEGSVPAMLRLQGSSARYYQRPDADYVEVDPDLTRLDGYTGGLRLGKIEGAWRWTLSGEARSPGFEINDVGAMATADDLAGYARLAWGRPFASGPFQRVDLAASVASGWNFGSVKQYTTPALDAFLVWHNFWRTTFRYAYDTRALSDSLTRGGPLMGTGKAWRSRAGIASNDAHRLVWSLDGTYGEDEFGGWSWSATTQLLARRGRFLTLSIAPGYERGLDSRQYHSTLLGGRPETFGGRYVFAELDRRTVYARLRAGIAITPTLSLDLYAEPFAASGSYARLGELAVASGRDLRIYGVAPGTSIVRQEDLTWLVTDGDASFVLENLDFDLTSYRSNVVLRWEFLTGSTLFLVWQQNRVEEGTLGEPVGPPELIDVFDVPAEDVFSAKISFRLGPS